MIAKWKSKTNKEYIVKFCNQCEVFGYVCDTCNNIICNGSGCEYCLSDYQEFQDCKFQLHDYMSEDEIKILDKAKLIKELIQESIHVGHNCINWQDFKDAGKFSKYDLSLIGEFLGNNNEKTH